MIDGTLIPVQSEFVRRYWRHTTLTMDNTDIEEKVDAMFAKFEDDIESIDTATDDWKEYAKKEKKKALPVARVKKIMKSEEIIITELKRQRVEQTEGATDQHPQRFMIAGEAPVLLGKACELLVRELSLRAWRHTERNRRRTLQKQDVHAAVGESEVFDFLIDIVPRVGLQGGAPGAVPPAQADTSTATYLDAEASEPDAASAAAAEGAPPPPAAAGAVGAASAAAGPFGGAGGDGQQQSMTVSQATQQLENLQNQQAMFLLMQQQAAMPPSSGAPPAPADAAAAINAVLQSGAVNPFADDPTAAAQWAALLGQQGGSGDNTTGEPS